MYDPEAVNVVLAKLAIPPEAMALAPAVMVPVLAVRLIVSFAPVPVVMRLP